VTADELRVWLLPGVEPSHPEPLLRGRTLFPGRVWGPLSRTPQAGAILVADQLPAAELPALLACAGWVVSAPEVEVASAGWEIPALLAEGAVAFEEGEPALLDAAAGRLYRGLPATVTEAPSADELLAAADARARLRVFANAESPAEWRLARRHGAQGIGLCRLERLEGELSERLRALYRAAAGRPVTVRLEDPAPAGGLGGWRWCRAGLRRPELYRAQLRAVFAATQSAPGVLVPGPLGAEECQAVRRLAEEAGEGRPFQLGAMLELPRACLAAGELAQVADFLSFGTNDLTQAVFGMARDEARFELIPHYLERGWLARDPFRYLDERVLELMGLAVERARRARPDVSLGVCGDHAGVPANIPALDRLGVERVSCYPQQVPLIRLAAGGDGSLT